MPSTPEELATAIESLVASYMNEVRMAAQHAVERSLSQPSVTRRPARRGAPRTASPRPTAKRRTSAELDEMCEQLCATVRAQPGESIVVLAETMNVSANTLRLPMAKLRAEGRVRTVGQRHLTRYFPAVLRAAASKG